MTPAIKTSPYWWDAAPRPAMPAPILPSQADCAVIGSGCTGLSAALTLARGGRQVIVLESGDPGHGATSRATGVLGRSLKHGFSAILASHGEDVAKRIYGEARTAFDFILDLIERERIDCNLTRCGRFMAANTPALYEAMARDLELKQRHLGDDFAMVPKAEQHSELGSDLFHGGGVIPDHRQLHPGRFHLGLLERVVAAGATIAARTPVGGVRRDGDGFELDLPAGRLRCRHLVVATNGYSGPAIPALRRRVVPIDACMVATEDLPPATLKELLPNGRCFHDYTINADYGCVAPDGPRLLFGGLTGFATRDLPARARQLHARLVSIFPQLKAVRFTHIWTGRCAGTFDLYPHIGRHDGIDYAMGYCFGSGLPLGTLFGHRLAQRILGAPAAETRTAFDDMPFATRFFHWGPPWFVPLLMRWYAVRERRGF